MQSAVNPPTADPSDVVAPRATDDHFAQAYRPYMRAVLEDRPAAVERELAHDSRRHAAVAELSGARSRGTAQNGNWSRRILIALLLAGTVGALAILSQLLPGDAARMMTAIWPPLPSVGSSAIQPAPPVVEPVVATSPPAPPAAAVDAVRDTAPASAALSPEQAKLLETMPRDLADLRLQLEQLKASHEQLVRDNANAVAELAASQERMAQMAAENAKLLADLKTAEEQKPRIVAPSPASDDHLVQPRSARATREAPRQSARRPRAIQSLPNISVLTAGSPRPILLRPPQGPLL